MSSCPVCASDASLDYDAKGDQIKVTCRRCGKFDIENTAAVGAPAVARNMGAKHWRAVLSYWIRQQQNLTSQLIITYELLKNVLKNTQLPSAPVQSDNLISWLGNTLSKPAETVNRTTNEICSIIGATDHEGVRYVLNYLRERNLILFSTSPGFDTPSESIPLGDMLNLGLSVEGWHRFEELKPGPPRKKIGF